MHRSDLPSGVYSKQLHTKKWLEIEKYYEQLYSKHFKKFYNGKPTKKVFTNNGVNTES
ncbi:MAG: hypothetical protein HRT69_02305 [Flavobacteriaceae bacterium]|nr:hypothetical protein [Flavobacteriaceae bacterium]